MYVWLHMRLHIYGCMYGSSRQYVVCTVGSNTFYFIYVAYFWEYVIQNCCNYSLLLAAHTILNNHGDYNSHPKRKTTRRNTCISQTRTVDILLFLFISCCEICKIIKRSHGFYKRKKIKYKLFLTMQSNTARHFTREMGNCLNSSL